MWPDMVVVMGARVRWLVAEWVADAALCERTHSMQTLMLSPCTRCLNTRNTSVVCTTHDTSAVSLPAPHRVEVQFKVLRPAGVPPNPARHVVAYPAAHAQRPVVLGAVQHPVLSLGQT